jgi:hypothetical protein
MESTNNSTYDTGSEHGSSYYWSIVLLLSLVLLKRDTIAENSIANYQYYDVLQQVTYV